MGNFFRPWALSGRVSLALLLLRCVVGLAFMLHGLSKIQNPLDWMGPESAVPAVFQGAAALSEFVGGFLWILGLFTPIASLGIAGTMAFAAFSHAVLWGQPFVASKGGSGSYELALVYFSIALLFLLAGPGKYSLDRILFGEKRN